MSVCVMWLAAHARSVGGGSGRRSVGGARRDRLDALLSSAIRCSTSACRRWSASTCTISPRRFGDVGARHPWGSQYGIGVHASSALASMAARIFLSCRAVTEKLDAELDRRAEHGGL
jgi:hypothetical protein